MKKLKVIIYKRKNFRYGPRYCASLSTRGYATIIDFDGDTCTLLDSIYYNEKKHQFRIIQNDYECGFNVGNPCFFDDINFEYMHEFEAYYKTK